MKIKYIVLVACAVCVVLSVSCRSVTEPLVPIDRYPTKASRASATDDIVISVLSYNVHGAPALVTRDSPRTRMPIIGEMLNRYDLALAQEDFAYHDAFVKPARHPVIVQGSQMKGGFFFIRSFFCGFCGSGLTTFSALPVGAIRTAPFEDCNGLIGSSQDCWATKGFSMVTLILPNGAQVDVYNLHLDAGSGTSDHEARVKQLETMAEGLNHFSHDRAVIMGGDFNLEETDERDNRVLKDFLQKHALKDSGARGGRWHKERLDYILYRGTNRVKVTAISAGEDETFVHDGKPLSDHPALKVLFKVGPVK